MKSFNLSRTKRYLLLAILAMGTLAIVFFLSFGPREPAYENRPLSLWLEDLGGDNRQAANRALLAIGSNAVPYLVERLIKEKTPMESAESLAAYFGLGFRKRSPSGDTRQREALEAFSVLGPNAESAIGPLTSEMLKGGMATSRIAEALGRIGPKGLPSLALVLTNQSVEIRLCAIQALFQISGHSDVVPLLLGSLTNDSSAAVRGSAALALAQHPSQAEVVVPVLIACLKEKDNTARAYVAEALGSFGQNAADAIEPLDLLARSDPAPLVQHHSRNSLAEIKRKLASQSKGKATSQ